MLTRLHTHLVISARCIRTTSRCLLVCLVAASTVADTRLHVATASNFLVPLQQLSGAFETEHDVDLVVTSHSSGKLYAQIVQGAPFDVFLSADAERPRRLAAEGHARDDAVFTYALGRLALWSAHPRYAAEGIDADTLRRSPPRKIAIANPRLAPYGAAAREVLERWNLWSALSGRIVLGENVAQAYMLTASGNAEVGIVALSQVRQRREGVHWEVPASAHKPIRQDGAILSDHPLARTFVDYLQSDSARSVLRELGYATSP